jgi:hypothetical protein
VDVEKDESSPETWKVTATAANQGYLDTSLEQGRRSRVAVSDQMIVELPAGAVTADPKSVSFPFLRGTRGSNFENIYRAVWRVKAPAGTKITVVLRSEKGGTDRRELVLK